MADAQHGIKEQAAKRFSTVDVLTCGEQFDYHIEIYCHKTEPRSGNRASHRSSATTILSPTKKLVPSVSASSRWCWPFASTNCFTLLFCRPCDTISLLHYSGQTLLSLSINVKFSQAHFASGKVGTHPTSLRLASPPPQSGISHIKAAPKLRPNPQKMLINGEKYACEACVRGHRVSTCQHTGKRPKDFKAHHHVGLSL